MTVETERCDDSSKEKTSDVKNTINNGNFRGIKQDEIHRELNATQKEKKQPTEEKKNRKTGQRWLHERF